ncbi:hypothetical protein CAEBREN_11702 [Caenorhabditis brenneri]|uniref:Uncharacterized protein n=1 Tax=Caenorhabditis brenneri TaxID=135651 RepID=G0PLI5_CAEBE|nr:hypothetical protein CAEBREN_11702 [Caenorhabditis brenneri]
MKSTADVLNLSRHVLCQECASVQAHATENVNSIPFWKNHLKKTNGIFLLELLVNNVGGGKNCELLQAEYQKNRKKLLKTLDELKYENKYCGYERDLIKLKLIEKLIQNIEQRKKQLSMPEKNPYKLIKAKNCPLCVMTEFLAYAKNTNEHNRNEWMNLFEHLWSNRSLKFEKCCISCLFYLNNRYSASCHTETEVLNIKKMGSVMREGIEGNQLKNFERDLAIIHIPPTERLELIQNRLGKLSGFYKCELRKMRMLKTFNKLINFIDDFRVSKGRVFKGDVEKMTKLFYNFISQWNLF